MKRKEFLKKAACGLAGGAAILKTPARSQDAPEKKKTPGEAFKEAWVATLMENMDKDVEPATRETLMNDCGRACARRGGSTKMAEKVRGDLAGFVKAFGDMTDKNLWGIEGDVVRVGYPKCYCELVAEGPERLPDSYCLCSAGWLLEMFGIVVGKPVKVDVVQTIKRGAPDCRFIVHI